MTVHELKCWPVPFAAVASGAKTAEARHDDRGFRSGDTLVLREWDPVTGEYTGARLTCRVRYSENLAPYGLLDWVLLSLEEVRP